MSTRRTEETVVAEPATAASAKYKILKPLEIGGFGSVIPAMEYLPDGAIAALDTEQIAALIDAKYLEVA